MDYIREFDIRLEKEMYYAGEILTGYVILDTSENFKIRGNNTVYIFVWNSIFLENLFFKFFIVIRAVLRGKVNFCLLF